MVGGGAVPTPEEKNPWAIPNETVVKPGAQVKLKGKKKP